jgi:outer membrane protein OmpA-like peptidoglycan-associated protein
MRPLPLLSAIFVTAATPVVAQVTVDLHALQALPDRAAPARPTRQPPPQPPPQTVTRTPEVAVRETPAPTSAQPPTSLQPAPSNQPATSAQPETPARPAMPGTAPDIAAITPIAPSPPSAGSPPPPPPPVSDKAATSAAATTAGLRLTFAPGQSYLSPESAESIKQLANAAASGDATTFNVSAYAPGKPDDPSTARRMSLSRAMAVRSALVADGVASARIFVRALGEQHGDGPPDRVDVNVMGANSPADTATAR